MAQQGGREVTTPVVMGEQLDPPKYGESWSEAASRVFFASYREYEQRVKFANAEGVVRRQLMGVSQLIPVYVQRCFAQHYYQRHILTAEELLNALKQHAGYNTAVGQMVRERAATEIRRVAKMQPGGGTVKDRVMHVSSALEKYFCDNPEVDALYRASNGEYLPGPAESVSIALVDGISPADFRNRVRTELTYVEGWKKQPNAVLRRMIDQAEAWKIVEAHGSSSGGSGGAARSGARQEKKQSAKGLTCHKFGEIGHIQRNCHKGSSPCLLYTSPSPRDQRGSRMPSSA